MHIMAPNPGFNNSGADVDPLDAEALSGFGIGELHTDTKGGEYTYIVVGIASAIISGLSWILFTAWTYVYV